jgi:phage major head subunit gpT-like protein
MGKTVGYSHGFENVEGEYYLALEEAQDGDWTDTIASRFITDQPQEEYPWLGQLPKYVKWTGARTVEQLRDDKLVIVNEDWQIGIEIHEKDWNRDKTGQIRARVAEMAIATSEHSMDLLTALIVANATSYDTVALYSATGHVVGGFTINNNILAADGLAGGAAPTPTQQAANIQLLLQRMLAFRGDKGRAINRRGKSFVVMVPTNMLGATNSALTDLFFAGGVTNALPSLLKRQGFSIEMIVNTDLDAASNQMHMFRTDARIKPFIFQEELVRLGGLGPGSEYTHMTRRVRWDADISCGAGVGRFELAIRGTTS